jgi:hypothetical protein
MSTLSSNGDSIFSIIKYFTPACSTVGILLLFYSFPAPPPFLKELNYKLQITVKHDSILKNKVTFNFDEWIRIISKTPSKTSVALFLTYLHVLAAGSGPIKKEQKTSGRSRNRNNIISKATLSFQIT